MKKTTPDLNWLSMPSFLLIVAMIFFQAMKPIVREHHSFNVHNPVTKVSYHK
jgi:hypothetical protein